VTIFPLWKLGKTNANPPKTYASCVGFLRIPSPLALLRRYRPSSVLHHPPPLAHPLLPTLYTAAQEAGV
jgi:hypothetical protein